MFERIYFESLKELQKNNIEIDESLDFFKTALKNFFGYYVKDYNKIIGSTEDLIKEIAEKTNNINENYNNMIDFLNRNIKNWKEYLSYNKFIESIAKSMQNMYRLSFSYNIDNAVIDTINRNVIDFNLEVKDEKEFYNYVKQILDSYYVKNNEKIFTSKYYGNGNNSRNYVLSISKDDLLKEMSIKADLNIEHYIPEELIIDKYSKYLVTNIYNKKNKKDEKISESQLYSMFVKKVTDANLNDKQKLYLINCINSGDYQELVNYRIITTDEMEKIMLENNNTSFSK